ncbi:MAG: hypothetical protein D3924_03260 [Candidatus Electrothrix sp. AR4]|nr:hypothetical protein [Candidatus Electrothrix sp. AR4]
MKIIICNHLTSQKNIPMISLEQHTHLWDSIPVDQREIFLLLSIPISFNKELGNQLLAEFSDEPPSTLEKILAHELVTFHAQEQNWYFDADFRAFLLSKSEECDLHALVVPIHTFLIDHYQQNDEKLARGKSRYLHLYHQLQLDLRTGLRDIFTEYQDDEGSVREEKLGDLVQLFEIAPIQVNAEPEYRLLKIRLLLLQEDSDRKILSSFLKELKGVARDLSDSAYDSELLTKEAHHLILAVLTHLPDSKANQKLKNKIQKKLERDETAFPPSAEEDHPVSGKKTNYRLFAQTQRAIANIVSLHRKLEHEKAWEEATTYLVTINGGQKSHLCKSYCNIATLINGIPGVLDFQLQYFDLAAQNNKFDIIPLTGKAKLLARTGQLKKAEKNFDKAYRLDPDNPVTLTGKAKLLSRTGRSDSAEKSATDSRKL